ncbi:Heavy metal-associated isoprenylated plant protein 39 [Linum grandiflorum]
MKEKKMTVIGTVDPVNVVSKLRKHWPTTDIISVGPAKEPEKKGEKKDGEKKEGDGEKKKEEQQPVAVAAPVQGPPPDPVLELVKAYRAYNPQMTSYYYVQSMEENPNACVIC